jgi:F-type H+-transporting ATPase subunit epsilon
MDESFILEIISPEKIIFSEKVNMVTIPSYEGDMSLLKNHISIIAFLRPGILKVEKDKGMKEFFFVQDGTTEFFDNKLVVLSSSIESIKNISKEFLDILNKETQDKISQQNITDQERYILNHKLEVLKEIRN